MQRNRTCGSCTMCCKSMSVKEIHKPVGKWCDHCDVGHGCKIYPERPESCRIFKCLWLGFDGVPESLSPLKTRVVLDVAIDRLSIVARCSPESPMSWNQGRMREFLGRLSRQTRVFATDGTRVWVIGPDKFELVENLKYDENGDMAYAIPRAVFQRIGVNPDVTQFNVK